MPKVAVVLSGCGHFDGAEIRESVLSLLFLDQAGAQTSIFAPDMELQEVNHLTGKATGKLRNVLVEAARIARGHIAPLPEARAQDFDALLLPGGFGAAKNLSDFALKGAEASVHPGLAALIQDFIAAGKPIGAMCIAPAVLAAVIGASHHPLMTIGEDAHVAKALRTLGATHENCLTTGIVIDRKNRIVTTSAYMRDDRLSEIAEGIRALVKSVLELAAERKQAA